MRSLLVYPDPPPVELARALDLAGYSWDGAAGEAGRGLDLSDRSWAGAIVVATEPTDAMEFARSLRHGAVPIGPVLVLIGGGDLGALEHRDELYDDFALLPFLPQELEVRLRHLLWSAGEFEATNDNLISYGALTLNLATYQAVIDGRPLDLTYMEYELLKFLAASPGAVFTRETLLNRVWGYEYFGGARTVDVHVRRLRAKLGEEHANMIQTVRSVGYRFGQSRWLKDRSEPAGSRGDRPGHPR